jgi:hypothetical protein
MQRSQFFPPTSMQGFPVLPPGGWPRWRGWIGGGGSSLYDMTPEYIFPKIPKVFYWFYGAF